MNKAVNFLKKIVNGLLVISIAVIVGTTFLQVFSRYIFNHPLRWTEELSLICLIWITFLGGAVAFERDTHFRLNGIAEKAPGVLKKIINMIVLLIQMVYIGVVFYGGIKIISSIKMGVTPALGIPVKFTYVGLIVGALFMFINVFMKGYKLLKNEGGN